MIYLIIYHPLTNKIPTLEYIDEVSCPEQIPYKCKQVGIVKIYDDKVTVQNIDSIDYPYETMSLSWGIMKMLHDQKYVFNSEKVTCVNSFMINFDDSTDKCTQNEVSKYANYFMNWFQNLRKVHLRGENWSLDYIFGIILQSEITRKMYFDFNKSIYEWFKPDANSEVISEYDEDLQRKDTTTIRLPYIQLTYYNSLDKTVTVIDAYNATIEFLNDDWNQVNEFVIAKNLKCSEIGHFNIKDNESTSKAIKDIINGSNLNSQSFVAIKINIKLMNSLRSK